VTWMPQRKFFVATEMLVFDFELFIGVDLLCQGREFLWMYSPVVDADVVNHPD